MDASWSPTVHVAFQLKDDAKVISRKPYKLSREKFLWAQKKIQDLLERKIIRPSMSKYATPCVIVPKENGDLRLCQDYRDINQETVLDPFPFPVIDDIICNLGGCRFFTKFDISEAFHQIGITEETRQYSAFVLPFGHYEMCRVPFG